MAVFKGNIEQELENNNRVSAMGAEGNPTHIYEEWIPGARRVDPGEYFTSTVLTIPGDSALLDVSLARGGWSTAFTMTMQYRDVQTGAGRNTATGWTTCGTFTFGTSPEAALNRGPIVASGFRFFRRLGDRREIRFDLSSATTFAATHFIRAFLTYGNL